MPAVSYEVSTQLQLYLGIELLLSSVKSLQMQAMSCLFVQFTFRAPQELGSVFNLFLFLMNPFIEQRASIVSFSYKLFELKK